MTTFVAIDFETADAKRDSACAVGLARVERGAVVYTESALIRPPRGMAPVNQAVHGIRWADVRDAPPFAVVWKKLLPVLAGAESLVAHNAPFDRSVVTACCAAAALPPPAQTWVCTLALAKKKWPAPASNKLPDLCARLGIPFEHHHHAEADAEAAARVYLAMTAPPVPPPSPTIIPIPIPAPTLPRTPAGAILEQIPPEHRTPAVVSLMRDAEQLGPLHAGDLVRAVQAWFARPDPGRPRCACGRRCSLLCRLCPACVAATDRPGGDDV